MTNITVLKDESLGGIKREYREVKRKARVGDRIVFDSDRPGITEGKPYNVRGGDLDGAEFFDNDGTRRWQNHVRANCYVLEPTDIVRIKTPNGDGEAERFRMVDRKAAVGDRVIVVSVNGRNSSNGYYYKTGDIAKVKRVKNRTVFADLTENADYYADGQWYIDDVDFRVLEPIEFAQQPAPVSEPLSAKPASDQAAELIAKLTTRVASLEKRVAALETAPVNPRSSDLGVTAQVATDAFAKVAQKTSVTVAEVTANLAQRAKEARQRKRDDIVKRAKEDVAKLIADARGDNSGAWESIPALEDIGHVTIKFAVDRQKRKVAALAFLRYASNGKTPEFTGRAVCAPGDVFNSHIGRAIALRRALGLAVPAEYFEAPSPTEVRVEDIVKSTDDDEIYFTVVPEVEPDPDVLSIGYVNKLIGGKLTLSDDSRESDSAEPRKEVA